MDTMTGILTKARLEQNKQIRILAGCYYPKTGRDFTREVIYTGDELDIRLLSIPFSTMLTGNLPCDLSIMFSDFEFWKTTGLAPRFYISAHKVFPGRTFIKATAGEAAWFDFDWKEDKFKKKKPRVSPKQMVQSLFSQLDQFNYDNDGFSIVNHTSVYGLFSQHYGKRIPPVVKIRYNMLADYLKVDPKLIQVHNNYTETFLTELDTGKALVSDSTNIVNFVSRDSTSEADLRYNFG